MGRLKLEKVPALTKAETRLAALKSIDPALDMGDGRDIGSFTNAIADAKGKVATYNQSLSNLDGEYNDAIASINVVKKLSARMLTGVGSKWTTDSNEYEKAGGTRSSERKKPGRKAKAGAAAK